MYACRMHACMDVCVVVNPLYIYIYTLIYIYDIYICVCVCMYAPLHPTFTKNAHSKVTTTSSDVFRIRASPGLEANNLKPWRVWHRKW